MRHPTQRGERRGGAAGRSARDLIAPRAPRHEKLAGLNVAWPCPPPPRAFSAAAGARAPVERRGGGGRGEERRGEEGGNKEGAVPV